MGNNHISTSTIRPHNSLTLTSDTMDSIVHTCYIEFGKQINVNDYDDNINMAAIRVISVLYTLFTRYMTK